nr:MAG TPA: hypothetical protein [Caudoviricetes sp.]
MAILVKTRATRQSQRRGCTQEMVRHPSDRRAGGRNPGGHGPCR